MEDIIQRLVAVDRECAMRVEQAKAKKLDAQTNMKEKKNEIYAAYIKEQENEVKKHKDMLMQKNEAEAKIQEQVYQDTITRLESLYQQNKDKWIDEIVNRCLK